MHLARNEDHPADEHDFKTGDHESNGARGPGLVVKDALMEYLTAAIRAVSAVSAGSEIAASPISSDVPEDSHDPAFAG